MLLAILELLCSFCLNNPDYIPNSFKSAFREYYSSHDRNIVQVTDCATYDKDLFYILAPGECRFQNREFSTQINVNSQGIRDDENSLNSPNVAIIGDSFSMGWGVGEQEFYPSILEKNRGGLKVLNASISSYGTARELLLLNRLKLQNPEYLIIQYHPSDFEENLKYVNNGNKLTISPESTYDSLRNAIESRVSYYPGKYVSQVCKYFIRGLAKPVLDIDAAQEVEAFLSVIESSKINLDSTKVIVFEIEHISGLNNQFTDKLKQEIRKKKYPYFIQNMNVISMTDVMNTDDFFILDDHLNSKGHQNVALLLLELLQL